MEAEAVTIGAASASTEATSAPTGSTPAGVRVTRGSPTHGLLRARWLAPPVPLLEARGLTKDFGKFRAVDGLDLAVDRGEVYGFLGPNGAGKTSTIRMVLGLSRPTRGKALIDGRPVDPRSRAFRRNVAYLPERLNLYPNLTATQTLEFFAELKGADKRVIPKLLERVGLTPHAGKRVGSYSKGMKQLLGVAQSLLGKPSLMVLDEPMEGLDPYWRRQVKELITEARGRGATVFFSSHILGEVEEVADRVGILHQGKLVAEDTVAALRGKLNVKPRLRLRVRDVPRAAEAATRVPGVQGVWTLPEEILVQTEPGDKARTVAALVAAGIDIGDLRSEDPTLEEVFLQFTGRSTA